MRRTLILAFMVLTAAAIYAQADQGSVPSDQGAAAQAAPQAAADQTQAAADQSQAAAQAAPQTAAEQPQATADQGAAPAADQGTAPAPSDALAQVAQLSAKLEEANATIDQLQKESDDLKAKAAEADKRAQDARDEADQANAAASEAIAKAQAAQAISDASAAQIKAAQDAADAAQARADSLAADADKLKSQAADLQAKVTELEGQREGLNGKLASFGGLRIDPANYPELLCSGFSAGSTRLGRWKLSGGVLSQTDNKQYFSRLTFPLVQSDKPVLYSFETKTGARGWVGAGIHFFAEKVRKPKGYGEGSSLLVWLTRDAKVRGNDGTYLQVYRSDSDVSMERVLDAKIKERLELWNRVDVLYEPTNEFLVIAINGSVRAAYRTYFGIDSGVTMSLRTLGDDVEFRNLEVRR